MSLFAEMKEGEALIQEAHAALSTLDEADDCEVLYLLQRVRSAHTGPLHVVTLQDNVIEVLTNALINRGVYPKETLEANPNSVLSMVQGWGAYWHVYSGVLECPHCGFDLRDRRLGPPFKLTLDHYDTAHDCTDRSTCPSCNERVSR